MNVKRLRLAVLVSGSGTNLQALLDRSHAGELAADIVVVASDRADAHGLMRARTAGLPTHVVEYRGVLRPDLDGSALLDRVQRECAVDMEDLDRHQNILRSGDSRKRKERLARLVLAEHNLIRLLDRYQPDYICLAGFMRLLTPFFLGHYNKRDDYRVINIHPALLPAFPGQHGYQDTFEYGCRWGGITLHFADEGEDSGPIIAQAVYPIWPDDELEMIQARGLQIEYAMYTQGLNWIAAGQLLIRRGANGRVRVQISDPAYRSILEKWLQLAFV